jgi:ribonucleoside-diphosphate reductase alpha chain/ribonucleoside-triphosphate reductase
MFMEHYVDHNTSITVHVRDNEWEQVEEWVWNNWDITVALSFVSLDDSFYELMPYESITEEEYEEKMFDMKTFQPSLLQKYEKIQTELDIGDESCSTGICPIR